MKPDGGGRVKGQLLEKYELMPEILAGSPHRRPVAEVAVINLC